MTDPAAIYQQTAYLQSHYDLKTLALAPNNARAIGIHLVNELGIKVFNFGQTTKKYNEPVKTFLTLLSEGRIIHDGNPVMGWAADNLVLRTDAAGLVMPDKLKSTDKIDPMVAGLMGFSEILFHDSDDGGGYNSHEFRSL